MLLSVVFGVGVATASSTAAGQESFGLVTPRPSLSWSERADLLLERGEGHRALELLEIALVSEPEDVEALWRAAHACYLLGVLAEDQELANDWYRRGVGHAQTAIEIAPDDLGPLRWAVVTSGTLANAKGVGPRETARHAELSWDLAQRLLVLEPEDGIAHSAIGSIHAEIMTMTRFERFLARVIGVGMIGEANWGAAERHQRRAIAIDPANALYRIELAKVMAWQEMYDDAITLLEGVLVMTPKTPVEERYLVRASAHLEDFTDKARR